VTAQESLDKVDELITDQEYSSLTGGAFLETIQEISASLRNAIDDINRWEETKHKTIHPFEAPCPADLESIVNKWTDHMENNSFRPGELYSYYFVYDMPTIDFVMPTGDSNQIVLFNPLQKLEELNIQFIVNYQGNQSSYDVYVPHIDIGGFEHWLRQWCLTNVGQEFF